MGEPFLLSSLLMPPPPPPPPVHVGVENLGVVRHVGRLLDGGCCSPF